MSLRSISLVLVSLALLAGCVAEQKPASAPAATTSAASAAPIPKATTADVKPAGEAAIGDRTNCLTSGEEFVVTADSPKVEYQGKTYYFCCAGCDKKFAKDPDKYLKKPGA